MNATRICAAKGSGRSLKVVGYMGSTTSLCRQTVLSCRVGLLVSLHTSMFPYSRFSRSRNSQGHERLRSVDEERIRPHASGPHLGHKLARIRGKTGHQQPAEGL